MSGQKRMAAKAKSASAKPTDERELIRELATLLDQTNLTEIEVERAGLRVRVARNITVTSASSVAAAAPVQMHAAPAAAAAVAASDIAKHPGVVPSPMVGTAYMASEPGARPFVDVGSKVAAGDT